MIVRCWKYLLRKFHNMLKYWISIAQKIPLLVLILISASSVVLGDYFAKSWSVSQRGWLFGGAFIAYGLSSIFYVPTLMREGLVVTSLLWTITATAGFLIIGLVLFREQLTMGQWIGIGFGVTALVILSLTGK